MKSTNRGKKSKQETSQCIDKCYEVTLTTC